MADKRCGTCKWARPDKPEFIRCTYKTPDCVQVKLTMHVHEGDYCPCWEKERK